MRQRGRPLPTVTDRYRWQSASGNGFRGGPYLVEGQTVTALPVLPYIANSRGNGLAGAWR